MQVEVKGDTIGEEEFSDVGWNFVRGKSSQQRTAGRAPDEASRRYSGGSSAPSRRSRSTLKKRVIASSRMPGLPEDHRRIFIRPRNGLDLRKAGHCKVAEAIMAAAKTAYDAAGEDIVCPNVIQNIVVVREPLEEQAKNYVRIKEIKVGAKVYNVNAYYSAGDGEGVIRNADREITEQEHYDRAFPGIRQPYFPPIEERGDQRRSQGVSPRSESAGPRSQCGSRPGHLPPQTTWAQKAGGAKAQHVRGGSPARQPGSEELKQIREENSLLKEMVTTLKEEIGALRKDLEVTSKSAPVAMETSAGPVGRKRKAVGDVAVSDEDGFASFRETREKSLAEITSILQQLRVDVGELKKQSADHGLRALETRTDEVSSDTKGERPDVTPSFVAV
ncbi:hypothetical protein MTO96_005074 [Rhipicephalus appendiculatus]